MKGGGGVGDMDDRQRVLSPVSPVSPVSRQPLAWRGCIGPARDPLSLSLSPGSGVLVPRCHIAIFCTQSQMPHRPNATSKLPTALIRPATLTVAPLPSWGRACASSPLSAVSAAIPGA
jgi:hypothetical protein